MADLETISIEQAKKHIFTVDADTYRQITGRSLTDVDMELLIENSGSVTWDPEYAVEKAITQLYSRMKQKGIENSLGLKLELVGTGQSSDNFRCIAYATGLKQRGTSD